MRYAAASMLAQGSANSGTGIGVLYTAPANLRVEITKIFIAMISGTQTFFLHYRDDGGTPTNSHVFYRNTTEVADVLGRDAASLGLIMSPGSTLAIQSSTDSIIVTVWGVPQAVREYDGNFQL